MRLLRNGGMLCLALGLALSSGCRETAPPKIDICIGDGYGGADCVLKDGSRAYKPPSALLNYWMTSQEDEAAFASFCYDAPKTAIKAHMNAVRNAAR